MEILGANGFDLRDLSGINVILGKNGCGKSYLLKQVEQALYGREGFGRIRYISPERGGLLVYEPGIDQSIGQDPRWIDNNRRHNQSGNFRQQSATLFRRLELLVLREIERDHARPDYQRRTFDTTITQLNTLLDRVRVERDNAKAFRILDKTNGVEVQPQEISSGEAELISLGIEFLVFASEAQEGKRNVLLVDEPDVHLHPDLQDRLARFILEVFAGRPIILILATHSTALLAGVGAEPDTRVAFMRRGDRALTFRSVTDVDRTILPIFGAHPLSNIFNEAPILLVEGEDDERIWQQAVRSSRGRLRVFPCVAGSVDRLAEFETEVNSIIDSVYDNAVAYSLRDRDLELNFIENVGHVVRMRLACRTAENLMLSDDVLNAAGNPWEQFQRKIEAWAFANTGHQYHGDVQAFVTAGFPRKAHDLKTIRNILVGLISNKPWEVLVGQAIALLTQDRRPAAPDSLRDYLGEKVCSSLLYAQPKAIAGQSILRET